MRTTTTVHFPEWRRETLSKGGGGKTESASACRRRSFTALQPLHESRTTHMLYVVQIRHVSASPCFSAPPPKFSRAHFSLAAFCVMLSSACKHLLPLLLPRERPSSATNPCCCCPALCVYTYSACLSEFPHPPSLLSLSSSPSVLRGAEGRSKEKERVECRRLLRPSDGRSLVVVRQAQKGEGATGGCCCCCMDFLPSVASWHPVPPQGGGRVGEGSIHDPK